MQNQFLGKFQKDNYVISRSYIQGDGIHLRLYHTKLTPKNSDPQATIAIIHGFGQHSGRFLHVAQFYVNKNYEVLMVDLRGFGYSGGARGCSLIQDLQKDVISLLKLANPNRPLFLYGHSLGGLVISSLVMDYPVLNITGVILTSPFFGLSKHVKMPPFKLFMIKHIGHKLQEFVINAMINPTALTKVNKHIQSVFGDRLMIPFLSVKMARSMILTSQRVMQNLDKFKQKVLIFHGKSDSVTNYEDSQLFISKIRSQFKALHLFENGYHQLQHDQQCQQMLKISGNWLDELPNKEKLKILGLYYRRATKQKSKFENKGWIIILVIYLISLIKLSRNSKYSSGILRILLSPILYILRL